MVKARCPVYVHGFPRKVGHIFSDMGHRVEHQELNQVGAGPPICCVFGVRLTLRLPQALIRTKKNEEEEEGPEISEAQIALRLPASNIGASAYSVLH